MTTATIFNKNKLDVSDAEDSVLLKRIAEQQDRQALAELYERYRLAIGSFLRRKLRDAKLIDEVYNDVMFTVWQKADSFRGEAKVSTWLFSIAYRTCLSQSRKEARHTEQIASEQALDELSDHSTHESSNAVENLRVALSDLSENHRNAVELAYYYGHSISEIALIVDCPENTVKTRLYHARQQLKQQLQTQLA